MSAIAVDLPTTRAATVACLVVTTIVAGGRAAVPFVLNERRLSFKDAWLAAAFLFYLALVVVYLATYEVIFKIGAVAAGSAGVYPTILKDAVEVLKVVFTTTMLHWFVLWSVKFSMLAFYKELLARLKTYLRLWWGVTIFTCLALLVSLLQFWFTCKNPANMFVVGQCLTPRATYLSHVSLWLSFSLDVATDVIIMLLPLGLIRKARMPLRQKIGIASIFCLALICVISSAIRVREVGEDMSKTSSPSITWLALWSIVEASIAVIIGCGPGLFELIKKTAAKHRSNKSTSKGTSNSGGVTQLTDSRLNQGYDLPEYNRKNKLGSRIATLDQASSSQERLTNQINVTQTLSMEQSENIRADNNNSPKPLPKLPSLTSQYSIHCSAEGKPMDTVDLA